MDETQFHAFADASLQHYAEALEPAYDSGMLDELELDNGILTIIADGKTLLLNKHTASRQLWLASPFSGGHHFSFHPQREDWELTDGTTLDDLLARELQQFSVTL
jgi:iron donor protein CyaY